MPSTTHEPRNLLRLWVCVVIGVALWFSPTPNGLISPAWHIFAVFAATIVSFLLRPLPMGACVLVGLAVLATTGQFFWTSPQNLNVIRTWEEFEVADSVTPSISISELYEQVTGYPLNQSSESFKYSLYGFADTTTWLVVAAFLLAGGVIGTGLGRRIALSMVARLGKSLLGLGYAIGAAELLLAPFIPSNTARGGGVMAPIVDSLSRVLGSSPDAETPDRGPKRAGEYLVLCGAHLNLVTAAMFLTGMAANPLVGKAAADVFGPGHALTWGGWLAGSIVPGLVSVALLPPLLHWLARPAAIDTAAARGAARDELAAMGPWTARQRAMAGILLTMLLLWTTGPVQQQWLGYKLPTAMVALMGVAAMVVLGVQQWRDVVGNAAAWDALVWLGGLVTMAGALRDTGFTDWFANLVGGYVTGWPGLLTAVALAVVYFLSMYAFSMLTGHILAFAGVFFAAALAAGAPPLLMVALIAYFSNLCGCTTNYSTGPVVIYYGLGYVPAPRWFAAGAVVGAVHLAVWLGVGLPYWKLLGWW